MEDATSSTVRVYKNKKKLFLDLITKGRNLGSLVLYSQNYSRF